MLKKNSNGLMVCKSQIYWSKYTTVISQKRIYNREIQILPDIFWNVEKIISFLLILTGFLIFWIIYPFIKNVKLWGRKYVLFIFLKIAVLRNFFLCQDCCHSDVPLHLAQPCYEALGRAYVSGLIFRPELKALSIKFLFPSGVKA